LEPAKRRAERTCLGCRQVLRQDKLVRFVLAPSGEILADYRRKLPGRGGYTCLNRECIRLAIEKKQFERTFRTSAVNIDRLQLFESLKKQILDRVLSLLGMARKSSNAVSGSNLVITALGGKEKIFLIFLATDISAGIGEKISKISAAKSVPCFSHFDKNVMGKLMGRSERSVIAIKNQLLADSIKTEFCRLESIAGEG
jgi:uncharacterized protein